MSNIATSVEQSQELVSLGVNPETADMWWNYYSITYDLGHAMEIRLNEPILCNLNWFNREDNIPAWSLVALLELTPLRIEKDGIIYYQCIERDIIKERSYTFSYANLFKEPTQSGYYLYFSLEDDPVDAAVETIRWLVKKGYITNKK